MIRKKWIDGEPDAITPSEIITYSAARVSLCPPVEHASRKSLQAGGRRSSASAIAFAPVEGEPRNQCRPD